MKYFKPLSDEAIEILSESLIIDIHCHPSLKTKLFNYKVYDKTHLFPYPIPNSPDDPFFQMQYDLTQMSKGGINAIWSSIYIIEKGFADKSEILQLIKSIAKFVGFTGIVEAFEEEGGDDAYNKALLQMMGMEKQVKKASEQSYRVKYVRSTDELLQAFNNNEISFLHSLEGAHMLGKNLTTKNFYLDRLNNFYELGVCSMTLGHFMPNDVCKPVNGIAPDTKRLLKLDYDYGQFESEPLSEIGKEVVRLMLEIGMIIDLNHVSPAGRKEIYQINSELGNRKRPLVFSHNGIRDFCKNELITPCEEEIKIIKDCNGVIGIIFMNYWLIGQEKKPDDGIENIVMTVQRIAEICGGIYDNIAIGTDMDGFTQPVDDLYTPSQMERLTQAMIDAGIGVDNVKKVLGGNVIRVLKEGWK